METTQRPLELILARNLLSALSTPAFLASRFGDIIFYNDAAGVLLGRRFEESGTISATESVATFGPFDDDGHPIPVEEQDFTHTLRRNRPAHTRYRIHSSDGAEHFVEVSGVPVIGTDGFVGAMVFFWESEATEA